MEKKIPPAPADRGRLWYDFQIPDRFLEGLPKIKNKVAYVRKHFPRATRIRIGKDSAWREQDIIEHIDKSRGGALAA